jgi:hypothetical protein
VPSVEKKNHHGDGETVRRKRGLTQSAQRKEEERKTNALHAGYLPPFGTEFSTPSCL